jgi:hypothetical protein
MKHAPLSSIVQGVEKWRVGIGLITNEPWTCYINESANATGLAFTNGDHRGAVLISAGVPNRGKHALAAQGEDQSMTAYVLVIVLAAGGHHQSFAVGYPDQGSCFVAAERLRRNKKSHGECLKFVQGKWIVEKTIGCDPAAPLSISAVPIRSVLGVPQAANSCQSIVALVSLPVLRTVGLASMPSTLTDRHMPGWSLSGTTRPIRRRR